jgi:hypothetical protein
MTQGSKGLACALTTVLCALAVATPAQAKTDRVVGGHATVTPSSQITAFLRSRGITVTPIGAMKLGNGSLTMPMVSGQVQAPSMRGTMVASGGLEYSNGSKHVRVHGYRLTHTAHGARLTAMVNGHRILIATMVKTKVKMSGKTGRMTGGLRLSAVWAHLINHLVGQPVVHPGEDLGDLTATVKMA